LDGFVGKDFLDGFVGKCEKQNKKQKTKNKFLFGLFNPFAHNLTI